MVPGDPRRPHSRSTAAFPNAGLLTLGKGTQWQRFASAFGQPRPVSARPRLPPTSHRDPTASGSGARRHSRPKKEASAGLAHTVVEIKQGTHTPAHLSPTVLEAGEAWIAQAETDGLERASVRQYRQHL